MNTKHKYQAPRILTRSTTKLSWLLVLVLVVISVLPSAANAQEGATLFLSPAKGSFFVGSTFDVSILINTGGNDVNSIEVDIRFPPNKLQVVSPTAGKSFIALWTSQPSFSNIEGIINLKGGIPEGINTTDGLITTITFRAKSPGEAKLEFTKKSKVLKHDGLGTNILDSLIDGKYTLLIPPPEGPAIVSSTHPDKNRWYSDPSPIFSWEKEKGVRGFSYELDRNPRTIPDNISEGMHTIQEYIKIADGIWYFHVRARKTTWGGTSHFPVFIDITPPVPFAVEVITQNISEAQRGIASFVTTDDASGFDHYELKIEILNDEQKRSTTPLFVEVSSPYRLPSLDEGSYKITVRAYDRAGNWIDGSAVIETAKASFLERIILNNWRMWSIVLSSFIIAVIVILIVRKIRIRRLAVKEKSPEVKEETRDRNIDRVFDTLEHDLLAKLKEIEQAKTERELTQKEKELRDRIINDLRLSENWIKQYCDRSQSKKEKS